MYKEAIHKDVKVEIMRNFLSPDISGGIEAYTEDLKIKIINTLEARLSMLFAQVNQIEYFWPYKSYII